MQCFRMSNNLSNMYNSTVLKDVKYSNTQIVFDILNTIEFHTHVSCSLNFLISKHHWIRHSTRLQPWEQSVQAMLVFLVCNISVLVCWSHFLSQCFGLNELDFDVTCPGCLVCTLQSVFSLSLDSVVFEAVSLATRIQGFYDFATYNCAIERLESILMQLNWRNCLSVSMKNMHCIQSS